LAVIRPKNMALPATMAQLECAEVNLVNALGDSIGKLVQTGISSVY
jgi:hypothetical protein